MPNNYKTQEEKSGPDAIPICGLLIAMGLAGWWTQNQKKIIGWYVNRYEEIYLSLWVVFLVLVGFIILRLIKKTKDIKDRGELLSPHWDQTDKNIFVGSTHDKVGLHLSDELRCTHVQIIGTTGRGKTQSVVIPWTLRDLCRHKSVILIDGKGSRVVS